jgi:hypothetical protein
MTVLVAVITCQLTGIFNAQTSDKRFPGVRAVASHTTNNLRNLRNTWQTDCLCIEGSWRIRNTNSTKGHDEIGLTALRGDERNTNLQ